MQESVLVDASFSGAFLSIEFAKLAPYEFEGVEVSRIVCGRMTKERREQHGDIAEAISAVWASLEAPHGGV